MKPPRRLSLTEWEARYRELRDEGLTEPVYGGPLARHAEDGDRRLRSLTYDESPAALRLWNFLLTEEERLAAARAEGKKLVGAMKDLGTVPVMAYSAPELVAFYPDGAWWIPCVMELDAGLLGIADSLGVGESFCPVRAMLGAFATEAHFPIPDLLTCSVGAVCDDFSAIAQRLEGMGHAILWWEMPHRRAPESGEDAVELPGGMLAPRAQVGFVAEELLRVRRALEELAGRRLDNAALAQGVRAANGIRARMERLRRLAYTADPCPLPALEMLIVEMLAIHYCSDRDETAAVVDALTLEVQARIAAGVGALPAGAARVFWVNPVADLRVMNVLEECGGRIAGTDYLFLHALDRIPTDVPPIEALAAAALADPMVGTARQRAERIAREMRAFGAEALLLSRIPGASHCALEGEVIGDCVREHLDLPVLEIEVSPVSDALLPTLRTRMGALVETVLENRAQVQHG